MKTPLPPNKTERMYPPLGHKFYLCLSDLTTSLKPFATDEPITVLDYGCGDSPYRSLFPNANYKRADLEDKADLDYVVRPGTPLEAPDATFDLILSSQVLEHVHDPAAYFRDCLRMLKPGGRLVATTHGSYPDHGGPHDYQRWTPWGMDRDVKASGLEVEHIWRLTTGPRAVLQYWQMVMEHTEASASSPIGLAIRLLRGLTRRCRPAIHRWSDQCWKAYSLCKESDFNYKHSLYVGLFVSARKPS